MAVIAMIMVVVLVAVLIISFIFEQEQEHDSEGHHQGLDFSNNDTGRDSNFPSAAQFDYSEKDNLYENGNIKGSPGYTSISTRTTDDTNYQHNNMNFIFEKRNSNWWRQNYSSPPHPTYNHPTYNHKMKQNQTTFFSSNDNNHVSNGGSTCRYCANCYRYQVTTEEKFINLGDGRLLCRNCYSRSMKDAEDCKFLFRLVRKFFGLFDLVIDEHPILLTDEYEIMRLRGINQRCRGVFVDKAIWVGKRTTKLTSWSLEEGKIKKISVPQKKTSREAWVLLTFGYPRVGTGATLAHEMMHSWLRRKKGLIGHRKLEKTVEEGICEVMAAEWTDWYIANKYDSDDQFVQKLIPIYKAERARAEGYKEAWDAVQKHGLKPTLKHLVKTRKFPTH